MNIPLFLLMSLTGLQIAYYLYVGAEVYFAWRSVNDFEQCWRKLVK